MTNHQEAKNFKLVKAPLESPTFDHWQEVVPHRPENLLISLEVFKDFFVLAERSRGLPQIHVYNLKEKRDYILQFPEETYNAYPENNFDYESKVLRYVFNSFNTPTTEYDFQMDDQKQQLIKSQKVSPEIKVSDYQTKRAYAQARDGQMIPISLVYKKKLKKADGNPLLLYAYGSYGESTDPYYDSSLFSLLERGFIYAMVHVRGGQELGRGWYEDGKLLKKKNTFTDFIDGAQYLISEKYTRPEWLFAEGGSAGGLLMGAVSNMAPELFRGIIAEVPFVDVLTTMLDESIPLTTAEYDEWGDPREKIYYDYMASYSPYDNVQKMNYPAMLVTAGLHDSQVQYWEPAKWVAKLRSIKTDSQPLLLKTNMDAGHSGESGRYQQLKDQAFTYTFILHLLE